jgi:hypothetical protein
MELTLPDATNETLAGGMEAKERLLGEVAALGLRITKNWHKSKEGILAVATDCAFARENLTPAKLQELYKTLPFGQSMFSKLASIGADERLLANRDSLPPSITTMYLAHNLSDDHFYEAISKGVLSADCRRKDVENLSKRTSDKRSSEKISTPRSAKPNTEVQLSRVYCVYADEPLSAEHHERLQGAVIELAEKEGLKAAVFPGENLISEIQAWLKKPQQQD